MPRLLSCLPICPLICLLYCLAVPGSATAATPADRPASAASGEGAAGFAPVLRSRPLALPRDTGAHPAYRTEWWYATGWLETPDGKPLGFQLTFFRAATGKGKANPSRFAPQQLILAHAALSDPAHGRLLHDERSARAGFGLAYAKEGNTDVKVDDWFLLREADGRYRAQIRAADFRLQLTLAPSQAPLLQGVNGYSQKGPRPEQASHYYSEAQLAVSGSVERAGKSVAVQGRAWLDHEWSSTLLAADAAGWDWLGANLDDGGALMAFQIRATDGRKIWAHATLRDGAGRRTDYSPEEVDFQPLRHWTSPRTGARWPVAQSVRTGPLRWQLTPLMDDQELDARRSTGAVYWEGAMQLLRDDQPVGRAYLELTGYFQPLKL